MNTIEERAKKFVERRTHLSFKEALSYQGSTYVNAVMQSYIEVATDQRKIDTDIICDLMIDMLNDGMIETRDIGAVNMRIRKAMEEQS